MAQFQAGETRLALRYFAEVLAADSTRADAYDAMASAHGMLGNQVEGLLASEAAVRLAPENPAFLSNRAQAYRRFGRDDDALADLDRALALEPGFVAALFNRGSLRFQRGDYAGALDDFSAAIAADPTSAPPYFNRAVTQEALGRLEEAKRDLEAFLQRTDQEQGAEMARQLLRRWDD
ncbi:MAG: tetratricopeptide repeat protein [Gemmatimonadota bacterium]